jgi:hypothetical protein
VFARRIIPKLAFILDVILLPHGVDEAASFIPSTAHADDPLVA